MRERDDGLLCGLRGAKGDRRQGQIEGRMGAVVPLGNGWIDEIQHVFRRDLDIDILE